jgi:hypothetical protein
LEVEESRRRGSIDRLPLKYESGIDLPPLVQWAEWFRSHAPLEQSHAYFENPIPAKSAYPKALLD